MHALAIALVLAAAPDFDAFVDSTVERPLITDPLAAHQERRLGVPTMLWVLDSHDSADESPVVVARRQLQKTAASYRLDSNARAQLVFRRMLDLGHGAIVVSFGRSIGDVPVFRDAFHVVMTQQRRVIAVTGYVNPHHPKFEHRSAFRLTEETATSSVIGGTFHVTGVRDGWQQLTSTTGDTARARRVWFGLPDSLEPAWHIEQLTDDAMSFVVSANDGRPLNQKHLRDDAEYRVFADSTPPYAPLDSPYGTVLTPHPTGLATPLIEGAWVAATLINTDARPGFRDPWLASGATTLQGNNTFIFTDVFAPFGVNSDAGLPDGGVLPQDFLTAQSSTGVFGDTYDLSLEPTVGAQASAASTQLFFTTNWVHDWLYAAGFDEAAGNMQNDTFNRGGLGNDAILGANFSYSRPNNASMTTFADGEPPRMQMGNFAVEPVRYAEFTDAGRVAVSFSTDRATFEVTARVVMMRSDAGDTGCDDLFDPAELEGAIAATYDGTCALSRSLDRAADAGAVALLVLPRTQQFPSIAVPDASVDLPIAGLPRASLPLLDAGTPLRLVFQRQPRRPSSLDTHVVVHEIGHALSNRLIADTAGLQLAISRSMGEGWSDLLSLLQTIRASDAAIASNTNWNGTFAVGAYVTGGLDVLGAPLPHHFSGIRRLPYSASFEKNGLTFRHIRDGAALPNGAPSFAPNAEVHNAGEVWCAMLWEGFTAMLRSSPDVEAQRTKMLELLIASLAATPANPDFLEARDALLAVTFADDTALYQSMSSAFSRRGAGPLAVAPQKLSVNNAPVVEDFSTADAVKVSLESLDDSVKWCDRDGRLDSNETGQLTVSARNVGLMPRSAARTMRIRALSPGATVLGDGLVSFDGGAPFEIQRASVPVSLEASTEVRSLEFQVEAVDTTGPSTILTVLANADDIASATEDFERTVTLDRGTGWRRGEDLDEAGDTRDSQWNLNPQTPTQTVVTGPNADTRGRIWLTTPPLSIESTAVTLRFRHRYQFEQSMTTNWDGASIEISDDDQRTWTQVPSSSLTPQYSGAISTMGSQGPVTNPHAGRAAWVGRSTGYPNFTTQSVRLGTAYAGKVVSLRFMIATDQSGGGSGWDIDDIEVIGLSTTPFTQRVVDRARCTNRPPTVDAGPDRREKEGARVTLEALVLDPDGDVATLEWKQTRGPTVELTAGTFTAPSVTALTELEFEAIGKDAAFTVTDRIIITVEPVNTPPTVMLGAPTLVRSGERFTIVATTSDIDGDTLETTFVQTRGPLAKPVEGGTFIAPAVKAPDRMYFDVFVSDGQSTTVAKIEVGLEPSACGCTSAPWPLMLGALLVVSRRRRTRSGGGRR